jgi:hypothetical protein
VIVPCGVRWRPPPCGPLAPRRCCSGPWGGRSAAAARSCGFIRRRARRTRRRRAARPG